MGEQEINDKPRQRFTRCPPSQKPTDPRVRPRPSESQREMFLTTLKRPASFIPPKMRPSQERSARLSEPLLLAHPSLPVPSSSSSLAHSRSTVSPSAESTPATLSPLPRRSISLVLTRRRLRRPLTQSTSRPLRVRRRAQRRLSSHRERRQRRRSHLPAVPQTRSPSTRLCCLPSRRSQCSPHASAAASACERVTGHTRWLGKAIIFFVGAGQAIVG